MSHDHSQSYMHVPEGIRVFPNVWPGDPPPVQPGDVTKFVPMGCCFNGPVIVRPWETLEGAVSASGYYGARGHSFHPLHGAPVTEASGGVLYFDSGSEPSAVDAALRLMHAPLFTKEFAVFLSESKDAQKDGFLVHCRMMPFSSLPHLFGVRLEAVEGGATPQPMTMGDFIHGFIDIHEKRHGTGMCSDLYGTMGGDGDWAKESLCFGFMIENEYHSVCRIWSRAWLVTK